MSTAAVHRARSAENSDGKTRWLTGPVADLVVGCGAWSAPLLALTFFLNDRYSTQTALAFYALALFSNYPHFYATVYRVYRTKSEFARYRLFALHVTALLVGTAVLAHWSHAIAPILFTAYITWSPWHYSGQNFGLAMLFARRNGASPTRADRNWLLAAFVASYLMIFVTLHSGPSVEPYVLSLGMPVGLGRVTRLLLCAVFLVAAVRAVWPLVRSLGAPATAAPITLLVTQFLWFALPTFLEIGFGIQVPRTSYSASILAFMHGAQYLWITSYFTRREAEEGTAGREGARWGAWTYYGTLVVGGIALFLPGPWLVSYVFHHDFTSSFLIFTALVNIHHFVLDGTIWKLRDGRIAALLVGAKAERAGGAAERSSRGASILGRLRWLTGASVPARVVRVVAVALLVAIAGLDLTRHFLAFGSTDLGSVAGASALNPFDATVHTRLAAALANEGRTDDAVVSLRRAVDLDPYNAGAQRLLARALVERGSAEAALEHHRRMLQFVPPDPDTLVNYGFLAMQAGGTDEAIDAWRKAVAIDDAQPLAHFYLGSALEAKGRKKDAVTHYEKYLALAVSPRFREGFNVLQVMRAGLVVGDGYNETGRFKEAGEFYRRVAALAEQSGEHSFLVSALGRLGPLYGEHGNKAEAVACFTRAIAISRERRDTRAEATTWFNYGKFLGTTQSSALLAAACFVRAEQGLSAEDGPDREAIAGTLANYQETYGRQFIASVREDLDDLLEQALAYKPS
jgi:tetratricopeptide (TPR) repeat protein